MSKSLTYWFTYEGDAAGLASALQAKPLHDLKCSCGSELIVRGAFSPDERKSLIVRDWKDQHRGKGHQVTTR